jgi:transposase
VAQNFLPCDRDQELLLPPSLREWLPQDHLAWFVLESVAELDLGAFYAAYRSDGWGAAAHDPQMMVALLVYAYAIGVRSARGIERRCRDDVAFRVITANQVPDHATIARFRARHEQAIAELFGGVLALCARAGLVKVGIVAVDGTKIAAAATHHATRSYEQIAEEILAEAARIDAAEDELYGEARGDELPEGLRTSGDRRKWLREARQALEAERAAKAEPFRGAARSGWPSASAGSRRTGGSSGGSSRSTRLGTRAGSPATGRGGWPGPERTSSPTRCPSSRPGS